MKPLPPLSPSINSKPTLNHYYPDSNEQTRLKHFSLSSPLCKTPPSNLSEIPTAPLKSKTNPPENETYFNNSHSITLSRYFAYESHSLQHLSTISETSLLNFSPATGRADYAPKINSKNHSTITLLITKHLTLIKNQLTFSFHLNQTF
jgi:hypothetical protein